MKKVVARLRGETEFPNKQKSNSLQIPGEESAHGGSSEHAMKPADHIDWPNGDNLKVHESEWNT